MTDNFAFYSPTRHTRLEQSLGDLLPDCRLTTSKNDDFQIEKLTLEWPDLSVEINLMPPDQIAGHLAGFAGYVNNIYGGKLDQRGGRIVEFLLRVKTVIGMVVEPERDRQGRVQKVITQLCAELHPIMFYWSSLFDHRGKALLRPDKSYDSESDLEYLDPARWASTTAMERKRRSEAILAGEKIRFMDSLPPIDSEDEARRRSAEEVAARALALWLVASKGVGLEQTSVLQYIRKYRLEKDLSPEEEAFANNPAAPEHDQIDFGWRWECCWVMLWALGYIERMGPPDAQCEVDVIHDIVTARSRAEFLADANLRTLGEILDEADLIYRYSWAVVDARINGREPPEGLDAGVTYQRHYALNWLIGYMNQGWDTSARTRDPVRPCCCHAARPASALRLPLLHSFFAINRWMWFDVRQYA